MKTYTEAELNEILRKHDLWLKNDPAGVRANLWNADLRGADLRNAKLESADLRGADLRGANLRNADLRNANLWNADLRGANLRGANLRGANLESANLYGADLWNANLWNADLRGANLYGADLRGANLWNADLWNANLWNADLRNADLRDAKNVNYPIACPEEGSFTAFKKAYGYIVKLEIPEDAQRSSATTRKCRCSKAKVISITNLDGTPADIPAVKSGYDSNFVYAIGETVSVDNFDPDRWNECAPGIHFFITRQEAVDY